VDGARSLELDRRWARPPDRRAGAESAAKPRETAVNPAACMLGEVVAGRPSRRDSKEDDMPADTAPTAAGRHFSAPSGAQTQGRLEFSRGAAHLAIHGASMEDLFRAHFEQPIPSVTVDGGTVSVEYPRFSPRGWLRTGAHRGGTVTLNQDMAWHITIRGGVAHLDADLRDLRLEALELGQGASRVEVRLPRPAGVVPVRVRGGASQVRIRRPAGVPVRLRIGRGVADLRFDEQEWGAVGGGLRLVTPEATQAPDRYEIEIASGAAHLEISAEERG
jgi:hypothetical protein